MNVSERLLNKNWKKKFRSCNFETYPVSQSKIESRKVPTKEKKNETLINVSLNKKKSKKKGLDLLPISFVQLQSYLQILKKNNETLISVTLNKKQKKIVTKNRYETYLTRNLKKNPRNRLAIEEEIQGTEELQ